MYFKIYTFPAPSSLLWNHVLQTIQKVNKAKDDYQGLLSIMRFLWWQLARQLDATLNHVKQLKIHNTILFKTFPPDQADELRLIDCTYPLMMVLNLKISQPYLQENSSKFLYDWCIWKILKLQKVKEKKCESSPNSSEWTVFCKNRRAFS